MLLNRELLTDWKKREGRTWAWVAEKLSVTTETFYHQLGGRCGVSLELVLKLEDVTGIPVRQLVVKRERPKGEKASA